jgi:hypothetical protein
VTFSHIAQPEKGRSPIWWQRIASEAEEVLAVMPEAAARGAAALPGDYARRGSDHDLDPWSVVYDAERVKPLGPTRFLVGFVVDDAIEWVREDRLRQKALIKAADPASDLLRGSGPTAAMQRIALFVLRAPIPDRMDRIRLMRAP